MIQVRTLWGTQVVPEAGGVVTVVLVLDFTAVLVLTGNFAVVLLELLEVGGEVLTAVAVVGLTAVVLVERVGAARTVMSAQLRNCSPQFGCSPPSGQVPQKEPHHADASHPAAASLEK